METAHNHGFILASMDAGEKIRAAREAKGWSQADLGSKVGITQPAILKIELGKTVRSKYLPEIAAVLDIELDGIAQLKRPLALPPEVPVIIPGDQLMQGRDFPVYSSAEGGPGEILVNFDPVDFKPRPAPVANVKGAYGIIVTGTSMQPAFWPGDTAIVNPNLPPIGGEDYVFYTERHGEARATIKRLRRYTADTWFVTQWNPPPRGKQDFVLLRKEWHYAHRVLGRYSRG